MNSLDILGSDPLNVSTEITKIKIWKENKKYFLAHQKFSKIFHGPYKNPTAHLPHTYFMVRCFVKSFYVAFKSKFLE